MKDLLFKKVKCNGFLKKVYDGRYVEVDKYGNCEYIDTNNKDLNITCEYCGDEEFLKTYYIIKSRNLSGMVVGFKDIVINGYLCVDSNADYLGSEHIKISKRPNEIVKCAIVYYADNRKSYVPIDNIMIRREKENGEQADE